jgi:type VI protein secretion system component Hcp
MADSNNNTDMLMMFVKDSTPVDAECLAVVDKKDDFTKDFIAGKYFEIDSFDMSIKLVDKDSTSVKDDTKDGEKKKEKGGSFSKWVQGIMPAASGQSRLYPLEMEAVSFSRRMDRFSPLLFQLCFKTKSFDSVVVVKRKSSGAGANSDGIANIPYFRVEFKQVLVVGVDWDADDAMVKEKCKFVCRSVAVQYRQQMHDGSAGVTVGGEVLQISEK